MVLITQDWSKVLEAGLAHAEEFSPFPVKGIPPQDIKDHTIYQLYNKTKKGDLSVGAVKCVEIIPEKRIYWLMYAEDKHDQDPFKVPHPYKFKVDNYYTKWILRHHV